MRDRSGPDLVLRQQREPDSRPEFQNIRQRLSTIGTLGHTPAPAISAEADRHYVGGDEKHALLSQATEMKFSPTPDDGRPASPDDASRPNQPYGGVFQT